MKQVVGWMVHHKLLFSRFYKTHHSYVVMWTQISAYLETKSEIGTQDCFKKNKPLR